MLTTKLYVKTQQITGEMGFGGTHMIHLISDLHNLYFLVLGLVFNLTRHTEFHIYIYYDMTKNVAI